jgi:hypothetical protein
MSITIPLWLVETVKLGLAFVFGYVIGGFMNEWRRNTFGP